MLLKGHLCGPLDDGGTCGVSRRRKVFRDGRRRTATPNPPRGSRPCALLRKSELLCATTQRLHSAGEELALRGCCFRWRRLRGRLGGCWCAGRNERLEERRDWWLSLRGWAARIPTLFLMVEVWARSNLVLRHPHSSSIVISDSRPLDHGHCMKSTYLISDQRISRPAPADTNRPFTERGKPSSPTKYCWAR